MNVWLAGLESGATYVGQIRGFANPLPSQQYHIALKVVYPNRFETSYVPLTTKSFIVPFAFITVPQLTGITPNVQFFPHYLSHCVVYDVHVKKLSLRFRLKLTPSPPGAARTSLHFVSVFV